MRLFLFVALLALGAVAGAIVDGARQPEPLPGETGRHRYDYHVDRKPGEPVRVGVEQWLELPQLIGDFDLTLDLELGEDTVLDVLVRRVEPRLLRNVRLPFHGRFAVLRLSTRSSGAAWRTREAAVFDPIDGEAGGGVLLEPGVAATVWLKGRGRTLEANVAGRVLPPFAADDREGGLTLIARTGTAAVRSLRIEHLGKDDGAVVAANGAGGVERFTAGAMAAFARARWHLAGALAGLVVAGLAALVRAGTARALLAGAALPLVAWAGTRVVHGAALPLLEPEPDSLALLLAGGAVVAIATIATARVRTAIGLLGLAIGFGAATIAVAGARAIEAPCSAPSPRLDALFGPAAGAQIAEALAGRVRGPLGIHQPKPTARGTFLLGGQLLYDRGAPDDHLEPLLLGELRGGLAGAAAHEAGVVCLPTADGWSSQQWALFARFYFDRYRPKVVVLGVPKDEAAPVDGAPRSSPDALRATVSAARDACRERGTALVLLADDGLPQELHAVLREAERDGTPLYSIPKGEQPAAIARGLAAVLLPLLR